MGFRGKFISTIVLILLALVSSRSFAFSADPVSCPDIDLREDFDFGPIRNQQKLSWCYAYSAADLFGYQIKKQLSPFDVALSVIRNRIENKSSSPALVTSEPGASINDVMTSVWGRGVCDAAKFSATDSQAVPALLKVEKVVNELVANYRANVINELAVQKAVYDSSQSFHKVFPTSTLNEIIQSILHATNSRYPLLDVVDTICAPRNTLRFQLGHELRSDSIPDNVKFHGIRGVIAARLPVMINYSSDVLKNIKASGTSGHASTLVGMHFNPSTKQCEFLLRNSWGLFAAQKYDEVLQHNVYSGYLWIPEEVLLKNISEAFWLY